MDSRKNVRNIVLDLNKSKAWKWACNVKNVLSGGVLVGRGHIIWIESNRSQPNWQRCWRSRTSSFIVTEIMCRIKRPAIMWQAALCRRHLTAQFCVQSQAITYGFCCGNGGIGTCFCLCFQYQCHSTKDLSSFIYLYRQYIILVTDTSYVRLLTANFLFTFFICLRPTRHVPVSVKCTISFFRSWMTEWLTEQLTN